MRNYPAKDTHKLKKALTCSKYNQIIIIQTIKYKKIIICNIKWNKSLMKLNQKIKKINQNSNQEKILFKQITKKISIKVIRRMNMASLLHL